MLSHMDTFRRPFSSKARTGRTNRVVAGSLTEALHDHPAGDPMDEGFDYAKEFLSRISMREEDMRRYDGFPRLVPADVGTMVSSSSGCMAQCGDLPHSRRRAAPVGPDTLRRSAAAGQRQHRQGAPSAWPVKQKYVRKLSWADLIVFTVNGAPSRCGFKTLGTPVVARSLVAEHVNWGSESTARRRAHARIVTREVLSALCRLA